MKVECIDVNTTRSDGVPGGASNIRLGEVYDVAEIEHDKYSIINDQNKLARYNKYRFKIVDHQPPLALRFAFNQLTQKMRDPDFLNSIWLISKLWQDSLENRNAFGYKPYGFMTMSDLLKNGPMLEEVVPANGWPLIADTKLYKVERVERLPII